MTHTPTTIYDYQRGLHVRCSCGWSGNWGREEPTRLEYEKHIRDIAAPGTLEPANPVLDQLRVISNRLASLEARVAADYRALAHDLSQIMKALRDG
jgi:hypothetical protein